MSEATKMSEATSIPRITRGLEAKNYEEVFDRLFSNPHRKIVDTYFTRGV